MPAEVFLPCCTRFRGRMTPGMVEKHSMTAVDWRKETLAYIERQRLAEGQYRYSAACTALARGNDLWSEDYHAALLRAIFALARDYPQIAGAFPFCFTDYRDPSKVHNRYWNEFNLKGLLTYTRQRKLAFAAVREEYRGSAD